jgi:integrase
MKAIAVESLAAWRGKIYKSTSRDHTYFKLVYYNGAGRKTLGFPSLEEAQDGAKALVKELGAVKGDSLLLNGTEAVHYRQAQQSLAELEKIIGRSIPINIAISDYVETRKILGDTPAKDAARYFETRHGLNLPEKTVGEVVNELVKEKRGTLSERHVADLESRLGRFAGDFTCRLASVTGQQVRAWLNALTGVKGNVSDKATPKKPLSVRSKNNYLLAIQNLVTFAKGKGYLPKQFDELEIEPTKEREKDVEIFTPDEVSRLLTHANEKLVPYVAIAAFAGVRAAELERLDWSKVNVKSGNITIDKSIAKTNSRRVIPMSANLKKWLRPRVKKAGRVCEYDNITNELLALAKAAGVTWKRNGLRHSFGSYRTAQTADIPRVSYEMGNSPAMVKEHYHELVDDRAKVKAYFAIVPARQKKDSGMVEFRAAA